MIHATEAVIGILAGLTAAFLFLIAPRLVASRRNRHTPREELLYEILMGDAGGLELIERIKVRTGGKTKIPRGIVYVHLSALKDEGYVESYTGEVDEISGVALAQYRLTDQGFRAAEALVKKWIDEKVQDLS